jgi:hypothetical protein
MMRRTLVVLLLCALTLSAAAADRDFNAVVKGIERHYGIRRSHPHLLGFALFVAKPAMWGSGAHGLKLAVFESETRDLSTSTADLDRIMADAVGPEWRPFVRVRSNQDRESSVIYVAFAGKQMRMLIASVEHDEIAVVHLRISEKAIHQWMDEPVQEARGHSHRGR